MRITVKTGFNLIHVQAPDLIKWMEYATSATLNTCSCSDSARGCVCVYASWYVFCAASAIDPTNSVGFHLMSSDSNAKN